MGRKIVPWFPDDFANRSEYSGWYESFSLPAFAGGAGYSTIASIFLLMSYFSTSCIFLMIKSEFP